MYQARICELKNVRSFPGADNLLLANASGYQVVVGKNNYENEVVALFIDDGQLSAEYLKANNLVGYIDPITNERKGGFFSENGRVKAVRLRGQKSEAYVASLESFKFTGYNIDKLSIGDAFSELNGVPICNKYFTPSTKKSQIQNKEKSNKSINAELKKIFPEHVDTSQFRFALDQQLQGLIIITEKKHGTCLSQDVNLLTENGVMSISDICDSKYNGHVMSHNIISGKNEFKPIKNYFIYENINNWLEIELENDNIITLTKDHLVWLPNLNCYREAKDLTTEDIILFS